MRRGQPALFRFEVLARISLNSLILWVLVEKTGLPFYLSSFIAIGAGLLPGFAAREIARRRQPEEKYLAERSIQRRAFSHSISVFFHIVALLFCREWLGFHYLLANLIGFTCGAVASRLPNLRAVPDTLRSLPPLVKYVLVGSFLARLFLAISLGTGFDEAYYYSYSLRPSLSYFDHPPFVGFLAGFFPRLTGLVTPLTIRLGAVLLFSLTSLFFYGLARKSLSERAAFCAYVLFNITPMLFLGAGTMILPDGALVFFWILALSSFWSLLHDGGGRKDWAAAGLFTGLAMLSKYHGVLLIPLLFTYLISYRRSCFLTAGPYLYCVLASAVFSPVIIWNLQHGFASFIFQGSRATGGSLSLTPFLQSLAGQALYLTPMILLPIGYIAYVTISKGLIRGNPEYRFHFFFGGLPLVLLNSVAFMRPILPHWTLPAYLVLMIPLGRFLHDLWTKCATIRHVIRLSFVVLLILIVLVYLHAEFGILPLRTLARRGWISERTIREDPTLDPLGWERVEDYLSTHGVDPERTFLFTHRWFLSAQIELATRGRFVVACFNSHDSRGYGVWDAELDLRYWNGIFVCTDRHYASPHVQFSQYFEHVFAPDSIVVKRGGVPSKTIYLYRCNSLLRRFPTPYTQ